MTSAEGEVDLLVEGEHHDQTVREKRHGEGEETDPMHRRALGLADEGGHRVRRTVTAGQDELLCLDDHGNLSVASREYIVIKSAGDYHCRCGDRFDGPEEALKHLEEARQEDEDA